MYDITKQIVAKSELFHGNKPILKSLIKESGKSEISNDQISKLTEQLSLAIQSVTTWWDQFYSKENLWQIVSQQMDDTIFD